MSITVVLPIYSRTLFALRWLWHANRTGFPFPIIIADGGHNGGVRAFLNNHEAFPNLSIDYFRRPDRDHTEYMKKCAIAVEMAQTPYVMFLDDDDFILPTAMKRAAAFLDDNADYVGAGGATCGYLKGEDTKEAALKGVIGEIESWRIMYDVVDLQDDAPRDRIERHMSGYQPTFYYVYRKDPLRRAFQICADADIHFMPLFEICHSLDTLISGKLKGLHHQPSYVRQLESSEFHSIVRSWHENYISDEWVGEINSALAFLGKHLEGGEVTQETLDFFKDNFACFFRGYHSGGLVHDSPHETLDEMVAALGRSGATQDSRQSLHKELGEIEETLEGSGFEAFVRQYAPGLLRP